MEMEMIMTERRRINIFFIYRVDKSVNNLYFRKSTDNCVKKFYVKILIQILF